MFRCACFDYLLSLLSFTPLNKKTLETFSVVFFLRRQLTLFNVLTFVVAYIFTAKKKVVLIRPQLLSC